MKNYLNIALVVFIFVICLTAFGQETPIVDPSWLDDILAKVPWLNYILIGLGSLVVLAQVIVVITPSKKDDEFMQKTIVRKIADVLTSFAPIKKK
jgi:hypothetical protein